MDEMNPASPVKDASYLASLLLRWESSKRELDGMEREIASLVLAIGKTQTVGNVRATYSAGRKAYDYQEAAMSAYMSGDAVVRLSFERHEKTVYDYNAICKELGLDAPFTQSAPSVTVKLLE